MQSDVNYYELLGVSPSANSEEIRAAYRVSVLHYHPDVNKAPNAQRLTEMLNSAYETLRDPTARGHYDDERANRIGSDRVVEPEPVAWDLLACDRCGQHDAQLRYTRFLRVWSIVVYTNLTPVEDVLCPPCRSSRASQTALFSAILGPWGFPFGIFVTMDSLFVSATGGRFLRQQNADLLQHQGIAFFQRGMRDEAYTNLKQSIRFKNNKPIEVLLADPFFSGATLLPKTKWLKGQTIALLAIPLPVLMICLFNALSWLSRAHVGSN